MEISIKLINNGSEYIANCPELDINCYGSNKSEAVRRIKKVIIFYIESAKELGLDINPVKNFSIEGEQNIFTTDVPSLANPEKLN